MDTCTGEAEKQSQKIVTEKIGSYVPISELTEGDENVIEAGILPFKQSNRVKAEEGLFDRMVISSEQGTVKGSKDDLKSFWCHVGRAPNDHKKPKKEKKTEITISNVEELSMCFGRVFKAVSYFGDYKYKMNVRSVPIEWGGYSLPKLPFSGWLKAYEKQDLSSRRLEMSSELILNPTRAANVMGVKQFGNPISFFARKPDSDICMGLDGNDNVVPISEISLLTPQTQLQYVKTVYDLISEEFVMAYNNSKSEGVSCSLGNRKFNVKVIETYWEFGSPDAIALVKKLKKSLLSYHQQYKEREHATTNEKNQADDIDIKGNAISQKIFLREGVVITVYAKTMNRVRFEVTLTLSGKSLPTGKHTANSFIGIAKIFQSVREYSADLVNHLLEYLEQWQDVSAIEVANHPSYWARWFDVFKKKEDREASVFLLNILRHYGSLTGGNALTPKACKLRRRAKDRGLIRCDQKLDVHYPIPDSDEMEKYDNSILTNGYYMGHKGETHCVSQETSIPYFTMDWSAKSGVLASPPMLFRHCFQCLAYFHIISDYFFDKGLTRLP